VISPPAPAETANAPATFTSWQSQNSLAGLNNPEDDPDADGHTNLLEYALGTSPASGAQLSRFRLVTSTTTGLIEALLTRPAGEHRDLRYILESSADLKTWTPLSITPVTTIGADQTETLRFADLEPPPRSNKVSSASKFSSMPISTAPPRPPPSLRRKAGHAAPSPSAARRSPCHC
jgi:hypothetical protein